MASWKVSSRDERGLRVGSRIAGVDPVHVGGLEDDLGLDLQGPQDAGGVGGEEGVAGAGGKDDHAALLQVADGTAPDVRLGHRLHPDGGHHPGVHPDLLQHVLQRQGVDDGAEHAHVVGRDPVEPFPAGAGAPNDVAAAHDQGQVHAQGMHRLDLFGESLDHLEVEAEALVAGQRLTRDLEQGAGVGESHQSFPDFEPREAPDRDGLAQLAGCFLDELADRLLVVLDERLLGEGPLGDELLQLAVDDLGPDVLRLALLRPPAPRRCAARGPAGRPGCPPGSRRSGRPRRCAARCRGPAAGSRRCGPRSRSRS